MTRMMFPTASAENKTRIDLLERNLPLKYAQDFDPASITRRDQQRSDSFGKLMAMALMTWARTDGGHEAWGPLRRGSTPTYVSPSGAGAWVPRRRASRARCCRAGASNRPFMPDGHRRLPRARAAAYAEATGSPFYKEADEVWRIANARHAGAAPARAVLGRRPGQDAHAGGALGLHSPATC